MPLLCSMLLPLFLFLCLAGHAHQAFTPHPETRALLSVKSCLADPTGHLLDWNLSALPSPSSPPCLWPGVACDPSSGSVISLNLSFMNLSGSLSGDISGLTRLINLTVAVNNITGSLPAEIAQITTLRFLNISNNLFSGSLPVNVSSLRELSVLDCYNNNLSGKLPLEVSGLGNLRHLHLGGNYFEGSIPPQYGNLVNLTYLALSGNSLTGKIPPQVGNLVRLKELYLGYFNQYDGGIPSEIGSLTELLKLDIADCGLTGKLPEELGRLVKLDTLFLQINSLMGTIPPSFGNLTSLRSLDLSNNQLIGSFPVELAKLAKLELISLFRNEFHGSIPAFFGDFSELQVLYLWENNMTGHVPQHLGRNRQLQRLDLSSNALTGPIPPQLCLGGKLERIILLNNFFTGQIPASLGRCAALDRLRLGQNLLTGSLPVALFGLPQLHIIEAPHNNLSGSLPITVLVRNSSLGRLDLSGNRLSGVIPSSIGNLSGLQTLLLFGNSLTGSIPPEIQYLKVLSKVDLSANLLTGSIPSEIAQCNVLTMLDLSRNQLGGEIPAQLQNLTVLDYLNVSCNNLMGSIPPSLQEMQTLTVADFSFNALTGSIPEEGQFANFNSSSFMGNPGLCGIQLVTQPCLNSMGASTTDGGQESNHNRVKSEPGLVSWLVLALISSLTIVVFVGGIFCNRHALLAFIARHNRHPSPWKLSSFQRFDFDATHVLTCLTEDNIIGKGGAGTVYKCVMPNGEAVAVKMLPGIHKGSTNDHGFSAEIQTLGKIRHRHIVRLLGCCSNDDTNLLVYEFMQNGSLGELLHGPKGSTLDWSSRYRIAVEAAKGLCYLHHDSSPIIVHRDVKSNNILLDANFEAHVADFGLAKVLVDTGISESMSSIAGSYGYIAPEYAYTLKVDEKSDIYSFGVVLLELLTGRRPIEPEYGEGGDIVQWIKRKVPTKEGILEVLDSRINLEEGCELMQDVMLVLRVALLCLEELPIQRPTMREVVQMLTELLPKFKESNDSSTSSNELMSIPLEKACLLI